jgi:hypothetical protein
MKRVFAASLLFVSFLIVSSPCFAATYYVPDDFLTIQEALDSAAAGDEIIVRDGVYRGAGNKYLDFAGKALTLRSENGVERCFIDCEGSGRGFYFHNGETADSVVDGFTIINGNATNGGGIECYSSSPTITDCFIAMNTANSGGGGIYCYSSSPTITNCSITGNTALQGGGIHCSNSSSPTIANCFIAANTATDGGGIFTSYSPASITNCFITANTAGNGSGICCFFSSPTITNCSITANTAGYGGGIYCGASSPVITNCYIGGNTVGELGGGIFCANSSPTITNCILWNDSPDELSGYGVPSVTYSDIQGGYVGTGNIDADPLFSGDGYHLTAGSPCIDAGTDAGVYEDIDGDARPTGAGHDMGCDEFVPVPTISCHPASFTTSCFQGYDPLPQGLTVWNSASVTLSYSISDDAEWLSCTPASGTSTGEANSITVSYNASGLAPGTYATTITISDASASNNPQYVPVELTVTSNQMTAITLVAPANESILSSPPTFSWEADGGPNNVFAVDLGLSYPITSYWSTYENMGLLITDSSWTPSALEWNAIPSGS